MTASKAPESILAKPVECMVVKPTAHALQVFIREDPVRLGDYPRPCSVDIRLPSWDCQPVIAVALLVSVARRWRLTCQTWIDPARFDGIRVLNNLSNEGRIYVHIVTDHVARRVRAPNVVRRDAKRILRQLSTRESNWSDEAFDEACRQIDTLYPTPSRLWRACLADRRSARRRTQRC